MKNTNTQNTLLPDYIRYGNGLTYATKDFIPKKVTKGSHVSLCGKSVPEMNKYKNRTNQSISSFNDIPSFQSFWQHITYAPHHYDITISQNTDISQLTIAPEDAVGFGTIHITVEEGVQVTIVESLISAHFLGLVIELNIEKNAVVDYVTQPKKEGELHTCVHRNIDIAANAVFRTFPLVYNMAFAKSSTVVQLNEEGAKSEIHGLFYGKDNTTIDIYHETIHNAPHTTSFMRTQGILDDEAHGVYRSFITMNNNAAKAEGHQKQQTLLLSKQARIGSVPNLDINQNDVVCSHSVSTANIDQESAFYLASRGLSNEEIQKQIILARCASVVSRITNKNIVDDITADILAYI
ncbi:MAG: hypothetical protein CL685_01720 [Candidatus Magasanikbacteria bacterium]|nr:hypothetical protein [Candidatus Magasanikbacteria bacterium]|tara:strand:- start:679 stop:1731 length:1053 start_codon:yes stop_codon:yes gene_type:complete